MACKNADEADSRWYTDIDSPVGRLKLVASKRGLLTIAWQGETAPRKPPNGMVENPRQPILKRAARQIAEYFAGKRTGFDLPLDLRGSPFQIAVWRSLGEIPYGTTLSYSQQAALIGRPRAARAVGRANGRNPAPIVLPCHRVVGADGSLTGFGGGLARKFYLLRHEGALDRALPAGQFPPRPTSSTGGILVRVERQITLT